MACGAQHCLLLTRDQGLYVWGSNEHGQLGLGNQSEGIGVHSDGLGENGWVAKSPVLLPFFNGLDIDCIVCGKSQSSVLVSSSSSFFNSSSSSSSSSSDHLSHDIYVWGWDSMSQTVACSPLLLELNEIGNKKVVQLVHGLRHSLLLVEVEKGVSEVWVWGYSQVLYFNNFNNFCFILFILFYLFILRSFLLNPIQSFSFFLSSLSFLLFFPPPSFTFSLLFFNFTCSLDRRTRSGRRS